MISDDIFMQEALSQACKGHPSPNPRVGCIIVKRGKIVGKGFHRFSGDSHAEVHALNQAGTKARGATAYVTLEPCNHFGKTPPCTEALIKAGIQRVVIAMKDPHKLVNGKGLKRLKSAGISCEVGLGGDIAHKINEGWINYSKSKKPFVVLKVALSLDGRLASYTGDSKWITSPDSRRRVHAMRDWYDSILVGVDTVIKDDPQLTSRIKGGKDPLRIILDSHLRIPKNAKVLKDQNALVFCTSAAPKKKLSMLKEKGVNIIQVKSNKGRVDLKSALNELFKMGVTSILVEGGAKVHTSLIEQRLADKMYAFVAPKLIGSRGKSFFEGNPIKDIKHSKTFRIESVEKVGPDVLIEGYF